MIVSWSKTSVVILSENHLLTCKDREPSGRVQLGVGKSCKRWKISQKIFPNDFVEVSLKQLQLLLILGNYKAGYGGFTFCEGNAAN